MIILEQGAPKMIKRSMEQRQIVKRSMEQEEKSVQNPSGFYRDVLLG